jgi:ankyrin repeat protein
VLRTLDKLPESLGETYKRILKEIKKPNRDDARRLLHCLVVAIRPLRVEELAEVLAVNYDDAEGIPKLNPSWRWEDQEQALLSSCSSLINIVKGHGSRVVQFSHFSVKEFLTSPRDGTSIQGASYYHIDLEQAHTIMAQACLGVLLQLDSCAEKNRSQQCFPLAQYAAEYWPSHARFKEVSTLIHKGMELLFDQDKPHFSAWLRQHDIDSGPVVGSTFYIFGSHNVSNRTRGGPLYYASLHGLHDFTRYLIAKYPEQVNARGGYHVVPLVAALSREHFQTAELLRDNGADPNVRGVLNTTLLNSAAHSGCLQMVKELIIKYNADINAQDDVGDTPLHDVSRTSTPSGPNVVRVLVEHGANVNSRANDGSTPLHRAARNGNLEVARVLIEHGADEQAEDKIGRTSLQVASGRMRREIMKVIRISGTE